MVFGSPLQKKNQVWYERSASTQLRNRGKSTKEEFTKWYKSTIYCPPGDGGKKIFRVILEAGNFEQNLVEVGVSKVKNKNPQRKFWSFPPNLLLSIKMTIIHIQFNPKSLGVIFDISIVFILQFHTHYVLSIQVIKQFFNPVNLILTAWCRSPSSLP